jgi:mannosyl-3-phosphoglycerate phosphatase
MTPDTGRAVWLVSDVDGTLLDDRHQLPTSPAQLRRQLAALAASLATPVTLLLASSRTLRELAVLQRAWGLVGPLIAEDGGVVAWDAGADAADASPGQTRRHVGRRTLAVRRLAPPRRALLATIARWPAVTRAEVSALPTSEVAARGIVTHGARRRAVDHRETTALIAPEWLSPADEAALTPVLAADGVVLRRGGRWSTLSGAPGKGEALVRLLAAPPAPPAPPVIVAIGNHANDASLLAVARHAFVINNPDAGHHPALVALPGATPLTAVGPAGWLEMLERLPALLASAHP